MKNVQPYSPSEKCVLKLHWYSSWSRQKDVTKETNDSNSKCWWGCGWRGAVGMYTGCCGSQYGGLSKAQHYLPRELVSMPIHHRDTWTHLSSGASVHYSHMWKQPRCPATEGWMKKTCFNTQWGFSSYAVCRKMDTAVENYIKWIKPISEKQCAIFSLICCSYILYRNMKSRLHIWHEV